MATSIGQYAPVFLPGEQPSLTREPGRPQSTGLQRVRHDWATELNWTEKGMATSIGQYAPVFLPGDPLSLTEKPGRPQSTGWQRVGLKRACSHRHKTLFACGSSAPVRDEHEGGAAAWLVGTLVAPSVQEHGLPPPQELWPYKSLFFKPLVNWRSEDLFGQSFSIAPPIEACRGLHCLGSFSVVHCVQHIEGSPWLGSTL